MGMGPIANHSTSLCACVILFITIVGVRRWMCEALHLAGISGTLRLVLLGSAASARWHGRRVSLVLLLDRTSIRNHWNGCRQGLSLTGPSPALVTRDGEGRPAGHAAGTSGMTAVAGMPKLDRRQRSGAPQIASREPPGAFLPCAFAAVAAFPKGARRKRRSNIFESARCSERSTVSYYNMYA